MKHVSEDDLIAYQLQESSDATAIAQHLEVCAACAGLSESIAETLRVFSAEPVPAVNLDHAWQRLRVNLPALQAPAARRWWQSRLMWLAPLAALLLLFAVGVRQRVSSKAPQFANNRRGPLTDQPVGEALTPAAHIDQAERLLTEVNHSSGPLDETAREQAHTLLLSNAVYVQQAHARGDVAQATVLENLGRVLTTLDHEQAEAGKGWHIRFEMNTDGLLLDLRILQQNDQHDDKKDTK